MSTYLLVIDQGSCGSLALVTDLTAETRIDHLGDGIYQVTGDPHTITEKIAMYPEAVLKLELVELSR